MKNIKLCSFDLLPFFRYLMKTEKPFSALYHKRSSGKERRYDSVTVESVKPSDCLVTVDRGKSYDPSERYRSIALERLQSLRVGTQTFHLGLNTMQDEIPNSLDEIKSRILDNTTVK